MVDRTDNVINLGDFAREGEQALIGKEKGTRARQKSGFEEKVRQYDKVKIIVPDGIYAITPSFLGEFLGPVVRRLGKKRFYEKVDFECKGTYDIAIDLNETVRRIIRDPHVTT